MRVLFNMLVASGKKTGIGHYASQLLHALRAHSADGDIDVFPRPWLRWCWSTCNRLRPWLEKIKGKPAENIPRQQSTLMSWLRQWGQNTMTAQFQQLCRQQSFDVYHEPNYIPYACDVPTIATIHDLSLLLHPEWHPADRVAHFEQHFPRSLDQCVHFLAVSEFSRQEFVTNFHVPPDQVTCVYNGVRTDLAPLPPEQVKAGLWELGLPERYLLYLGTLEPRKNVLMLMQVYCSLPEQFRRRWPLLLVGNWGWNTNDIRDYFHNQARHRGVLHIGYVADEHLGLLYNGARALVYPSFYEGFGLPPVEMMATGGAVLASTAEAVAETTKGRAHLLAPEDRDGWRNALQRVCEENDWWQSLRERSLRDHQTFTWEKCALDTMRVYSHVLHGQSAAPLRHAA